MNSAGILKRTHFRMTLYCPFLKPINQKTTLTNLATKHMKNFTSCCRALTFSLFLMLLTILISKNTYAQSPTITSFSPASGSTGIGVYIKGTNFIKVSEVRFNGVSASQIYDPSTTSIYATVPAGASSGKIEVIADGGTVTSAGNFTVAPITTAWANKAGLSTARSQHGAIAANGKIYAFGGFNSGGLLNSLEIYNTGKNTWSPGAPMPGASRGMSFALGSNGFIYVVNGFSTTSGTDLYRYSPATNTWTTLASIPGAVWEGAAAATSNGKVYVFGGEPLSAGSYNATRIYDIATNTWNTGADMPIAVKQHSAVTGADGKIYIFGGRTSSGAAPTGSVQIYNPATNIWSMGASMLIPKVQFGAVLANNGKIYVIGGKAGYTNNIGPFFHTVEIYDPASNSWADGPVIRAQAGELEAVNLNGNLYTIGGTDGTYRNYNFRLNLAPTIVSFSPVTGSEGVGVSIKGTNFTNVSAVRFNGVAASQFYVASTTSLYATVPAGATTGKIEVVADGRTATSDSNFTVAPITSQWVNRAKLATARSQHGAIATNGKIYVFGGFNSGGLLNSLEIYNPGNNTWSSGAPMPAASRGMSFA